MTLAVLWMNYKKVSAWFVRLNTSQMNMIQEFAKGAQVKAG